MAHIIYPALRTGIDFMVQMIRRMVSRSSISDRKKEYFMLATQELLDEAFKEETHILTFERLLVVTHLLVYSANVEIERSEQREAQAAKNAPKPEPGENEAER